MKKIIYLIALLILVNFVSATNLCDIRDVTVNPCPSSSTVVLRMSAETNAHAELPSLSNYNWVVCCQGTLDTSSSGNVILNLSADTNAHVATGDINSYTFKAYLNANCIISNQDQSASYNSDLLSMSALTNAHVAKPGYYPYNLSCNIGQGVGAPTCASEDGCKTGCSPVDLDCPICIDNDGDGYGTGADRSGCAHSELDCDDTNAAIHPGAPEIQDGIDNNCNGLIDESCTYICATYNYKELACRSDTTCNCYYSTTTNACRNCAQSPSPFCITFDNVNDCEGSDLNPLTPNKCGLTCSWDDNQIIKCLPSNSCTLEGGDADNDGICDDNDDNCPPMIDNPGGWYNPGQEDTGGISGVGDMCDPITLGDTCVQTINFNGNDYCIEQIGDDTQTCAAQNGYICGSDQNCIGGYLIISSDSANSKCCKGGSCSVTTLLLSGQSQTITDLSDCENPNEQGIGKKRVQKYNSATGETTQYEVDCTVLPDQTVPFYSLMSLMFTILILAGFYIFRRKEFS